MMCLWSAAIGYLLAEIQIDLNVRFKDQHYALGNLSLNMERRVNKIKGRDHIDHYQVTVAKSPAFIPQLGHFQEGMFISEIPP